AEVGCLAVVRKNPCRRYPSGQFPPGKRMGRQGGTRPRPPNPTTAGTVPCGRRLGRSKPLTLGERLVFFPELPTPHPFGPPPPPPALARPHHAGAPLRQQPQPGDRLDRQSTERARSSDAHGGGHFPSVRPPDLQRRPSAVVR